MIDYVNFDKFNSDSIDKQITLTFSGGDVLTNTNLEQESFQLDESICSDNQLNFGTCEASSLKFTVWGVYTSHAGQTVTVTMILDNDTVHPFTIGTYKVVEDVASADRTKRTMTCYDALYDILDADVASWYESLFSSASTTKTIKQIRDSFFSHFGITQESVTLIHDSLVVNKTIEPTSLSGRDVITAICQLNGVFGHITRDNKFRYVSLEEITDNQLFPENTLYPATDLYPEDSGGTTIIGENGNYMSLDYSDYTVSKIDKVVIRQDDSDVGGIAGTGTNAFVVQGNFLVYGKNATALNSIATALLDKITNIWYRPAKVEVRGNLCFEPGDGFKVVSKFETVLSYVLSRTYRGVQAPRDMYVSNGLQMRSSQINSLNSEIMQLRGKTVQIKKDVDEVSVTMTEQLDETVYGSYAYQTAQKIGQEVTRATGAEDSISSRLEQTATGFSLSATNGTDSAYLTLRVTKEDGSHFNVLSDDIRFTGMVTFSSLDDHLGTAGSTTINGGNITTGTISANRIQANAISAGSLEVLDNSDNTLFYASRSAKSVSIGGFEIDSHQIKTPESMVSGGGIALQLPWSDTTWAFAIGYTNYRNYSGAPFRVSHSGEMYATNAHITGEITATGGSIGAYSIGTYNGHSGALIGGSGSFMVVDSIQGDTISAASLSCTAFNGHGCTWKRANTAVANNDYVLAYS